MLGLTVWSVSSLEVTSVLNLNNQNLLLFTKDGLMISLDRNWCNATSTECHRLASCYRRNVSEIATLWNNSRVVGLSRVDASATFKNQLQKIPFLLLIQIEVCSSFGLLLAIILSFLSFYICDIKQYDLTFVIVNLNSRQLFAFGNGAYLFGASWESNPCLSRIVDIITDQLDGNTMYLICRESVVANNSLHMFKISVPFSSSFHPLVLQPFNDSNNNHGLSDRPRVEPTMQLENLLKQVSNLGLALLQTGNGRNLAQPQVKGNDDQMDKLREATLPHYLDELANYSGQVEGPIQAIDSWDSLLVMADHKLLYTFSNGKKLQFDSFESLVLPSHLKDPLTVRQNDGYDALIRSGNRSF